MTTSLSFLQRISYWTNQFIQLIAIVLLVIMLGLSLTAIFYQFILGEPITWAYSLTRLFLPWIALLSITVALKAREHIGINLLVSTLPPRFATMVKVVNLSLIALFGVVLIWFGTGFFLNSTQMFMVSDTLQLSHKWTAVVVPLTGAVITIHALGGLSLVETDDPVDQFEPDKGTP